MLTETIRQAIQKGLIKSRAIIVDSTHSYSKSNFETPTQMLRKMSKSLRKEICQTQIELAAHFPEKPLETATIDEEISYTQQLIMVLEGKLGHKNSQKILEKIKLLLDDDKIKGIQSTQDEEATTGHKSKEGSFFGYKNHIAMTDERLISVIKVTTGKASDTKGMTRLIDQSEKNGIKTDEVLGDMAYSSKDNIDYCNNKEIKLLSRLNTVVSTGNVREDEFIYNKDTGTMQCPEGHLATRCYIRKGNYDNQYYNYYFSIKKYKKCVRCGSCFKEGSKYKCHCITIIGGTRGSQYEFEQTEYFKQRIKDRYKIEAKNAEMKQSHGLARCKYSGLFGMQIQMYFTAFVANVKRIVKLKALSMA